MLSVLIYIYFYQWFEYLKLQHSGTPSRPTGAAAVRAGAVYAAAVSSQSEVPDGPLEDPVGLINIIKSDSKLPKGTLGERPRLEIGPLQSSVREKPAEKG